MYDMKLTEKDRFGMVVDILPRVWSPFTPSLAFFVFIIFCQMLSGANLGWISPKLI